MISKIKNSLKLLRRTSDKRDLKSRKKPGRIMISSVCGMGGSRQSQTLTDNKDPSVNKEL